MDLRQLVPGDMVFAATTIQNDGSHPDLPDDVIIAEAGARGVILNIGHLEENPDRELYLIRFERKNGDLGPPTGCWPEELRLDRPGDTG